MHKKIQKKFFVFPINVSIPKMHKRIEKMFFIFEINASELFALNCLY